MAQLAVCLRCMRMRRHMRKSMQVASAGDYEERALTVFSKHRLIDTEQRCTFLSATCMHRLLVQDIVPFPVQDFETSARLLEEIFLPVDTPHRVHPSTAPPHKTTP